jgi:muramoyltetrapeptide carboxypeptidase LdcA involved in peptidoglycan recycling
MPIVPPKLRPGSSVRVIAPSRSLAIIGSDTRAEADRKLAALGLKISFGVRFPVGGTVELHADPAAPRLTITGH